MLLDELIPTSDFSSRHTIRIAAPPALVYEAARHADLGRPALVRLLMAIRTLPAWAARRARAMPGDECSVGPVRFTLVAESPGEEFVLGLMGRFWTPGGGVVASSEDDFRRPPPAGLAQAVWNFRVAADGRGTQLSTETRVRCADPATRRQFGRYWRVIRFGSGLIRGSMLRSIRSAAERSARTAPAA